MSVPVVTLESIITDYFPDGLELLSLDTEGLDPALLKSLNYKETPAACHLRGNRWILRKPGKAEEQRDYFPSWLLTDMRLCRYLCEYHLYPHAGAPGRLRYRVLPVLDCPLMLHLRLPRCFGV